MEDDHPEVILFDGLEAAFLGVGSQYATNRLPVAVYSEVKIIECLMADGMSRDGAWEFYTHNIQCLGLGPQTPLIIEAECPHGCR